MIGGNHLTTSEKAAFAMYTVGGPLQMRRWNRPFPLHRQDLDASTARRKFARYTVISIPMLNRLHTILRVAIVLGFVPLTLPAQNPYAETARQREHDSYISQQTATNTRYFNNADNYPRQDTGNYARFLNARRQSNPSRGNDSAADDPVDQQSAAPRQQTAEEYYQEVKVKSAGGDLVAREKLAGCFYSGDGVRENKTEAYRLFRELSASSHKAEGMAGSMLYNGEGVPADRKAGVAMLKHAAVAGDQGSAEWLTEMFPTFEQAEASAVRNDFKPLLNYALDVRAGKNGRPLDPVKAVELFQRVANAGNARAFLYLGLAYMDGDGVAEDWTVAEGWFAKAYNAGDKFAAQYLGWIAERDTPQHPRDLAAFRKWAELSLKNRADAASYYEMGVLEQRAGDDAKGLDWYLKSAEAGDEQAAGSAGIMKWRGVGGPVDEAGGLRLLQMASDRGNAVATYELGVGYKGGLHGLARDPAKAIALFQKAADAGLKEAQHSLALAYSRGAGVAQDYAVAITWAQKAIDQGDGNALFFVAMCYLDGTGVKKDEAKAMELVKKAAALGDGNSIYELAVDAKNGLHGIPQDQTQFISLLISAAEAGNSSAQYMLGRYKWEGTGVAIDAAAGTQLLQAAALQGQTQAMHDLASCYAQGLNGLPLDPASALSYYEQSANLGSVDDQYELAATYYEGKLVPRDFDQTFKWAQKAGEQNSPEAQVLLAVLYKFGRGVAKDPQRSLEWMNRAATNGSESAKAALQKGFTGM